MKIYEYRLLDNTVGTVVADRYEGQVISGVLEYVFYKDDEIVYHFPVWWTDSIKVIQQ